MSYRKKHIHPKIKGLKKRRKFFQMPLFWIILAFFLVFITTAYVLFFWPKLQIVNIEISGNEKTATKDIKNIVLANINKNLISKSFFMVNIENIAKNILDGFPGIEDAKIRKKLPQAITLAIKERKPFGVFCSDACFLLDKNGIIFEQIPVIPPDMFVVRQEPVNNERRAGSPVFEEKIMNAIEKIQNNLKNNFQITIKKILVSDTIIVTTSENWDIHFDITSDIDKQIMKMNTLLTSEIPPEARKNLQYIYLQYKDRAYYK